MANKFGGTLVAATPTQVDTAKADRLAISIINLGTADNIYVEFGAAASTSVAAGSWVVFPGGMLSLVTGEYPEITGTVNLISAGTPSYIVRESTN